MKKSILTCLLLAAATVAQADVIDFEDLGVAPGTQLNPAAGVGIISGGFTYTPGPNNASGLNDLHMSNNEAFNSPNNGTTVGGTHDDVILAKVGGGAFSITSFDFAGFPGGEAPFRVQGDYLLGGSIFQSFTPDGLVDGAGGVVDFQTFFFDPGWTGLSSVTWNHTGGGTVQGIFALDNIVVDQTPIPEPASVLLLGSAGVLALAAARRRQKQNTKTV